MKPVVFAGPTLFGLDRNRYCADVDVRPPAARGDVAKAVDEGARRIGIIDGLFGDRPSVGHKEILFALAAGVQVLGAASMGALRAAECDAFGMIGIGKIYRSYRNGSRTADADVAIVHAPEELGYRPLSEAMVDVEASLKRLRALGLIAREEHRTIVASARSLHFSLRSWNAILQNTSTGHSRTAEIAVLLRRHRIDQKQIDAIELLAAIGRPRLRHRGVTPLGRAELNDTGFLNG